MGNAGLFDLEKLFAFYGSRHSNPVNVVIHMIFVWPILFTAILILYFTPSLFKLTFSFLFGKNDAFLLFNFGFLFALVYALFYISLDPKAGSFAALLCAFSWVSSSFLARFLGFSLAWKVVLVTQIVCWTGQFIGHGVFEVTYFMICKFVNISIAYHTIIFLRVEILQKRPPALLDNLTQALVMAPFFVLLEALQMLFGYEPYPGFHVNVQTKIQSQISEWQEQKQKLLS